MRTLVILILSVTSLFLSSCTTKEDIPRFELGTVTYHPKFLFSPSKTTELSKTIYFNFSEDAKTDPNCYATLSLTDNNASPISSDIMIVKIGDKVLENNTIKITSSIDSLNLKISFSPNAEEGIHQGYIRLLESNLDRIDNITLTPASELDVYKWSIDFEKDMNPLLKAIIIFIIICLIILIIWFTIIRPLLYPHFKKCRKLATIYSGKQLVGQYSLIFTNSQQLVLSNKKINQTFINRFFKGKIINIISPHIQEKIIFKPTKRKKIQVYGKGYVTTPNPMPYNGVAKINNYNNQIEIAIQ